MERMKNRSQLKMGAMGVLGALALCAALCACGDQEPLPPPVLMETPLKIQPVEWNGKQVAVGKVAAVAELYDDTVVFSDQGALIFTSGLLIGSDAAVTAWKGATVIPAGDLSGEWLAAIDGMGRVRRLRNRSIMEDVSDRYGLKDVPVEEVAALGGRLVGFVLRDSVAVADTDTVTRYPVSLRGVSASGGRAAAVVGDVVRVFDTATRLPREYPVKGAVAVAFDNMDRLIVASPDTLYRENAEGTLERIHVITDGPPFRALVRAGLSLWAAIGDSLALLSDRELRRTTGGVLPADMRLLGSPSGDLWLLSGGALSRIAEDGGGGADQDRWKKTVLPIFTRLCSLCHLPGGSAGIDLSTYKSWADRRALMDLRVVQGKPSPMPPAGAGMLTPDEMEALKAWIANK
jgi:hypothetical protein